MLIKMNFDGSRPSTLLRMIEAGMTIREAGITMEKKVVGLRKVIERVI